MEKNPKPESDDKEQSQRFVETARLLEVDESGESFETSFEKITHSLQDKVDAKDKGQTPK
jgi:hypothetical protein